MRKLLYSLFIFIFSVSVFAQEQKDISQMTKEDVLELTYDELLEMPFEDVMKLADIVGVSMDELYEMLLNKDVVSASKKVESSFEAPLSTSVVSYEDIVSSGARTIEEALRLVPGLIVREKTNGNFDLHIRGNDNLPSRHMFLYSENSITLVMIDGRQVYNYVNGGTFWETLPIGIEDIDRIEIVRGPSSALYGPNAVSGVINIITKKANSKKLQVTADAQAGSLSSFISSMGIQKKVSDKLSFRVSGNYQGMDRSSDLLYVFKANDRQGGYISKEELNLLTEYVNTPLDSGTYSVYDPADDINGMYPDPGRSKDLLGVNTFINYKVNKNISTDFSAGYQSSEITSSTMGDNPTIYTGRQSNTAYGDLQAKIYGLKIQMNVLDGWQDIIRQDTGFKVDVFTYNAVAEYDINIGDNLNIRPGMTYQQAAYNDLHYLKEGKGFLNGKREISNTAMSLRADYKPVDPVRLIAAVRGEKYSTHDDLYFSYQFIGSYNANDQHNIRFVYSRANRGPFLIDAYANYVWIREERPIPGVIHFKGADNLDLLTMDMMEFGYRVKPTNKIQADFEFFQTKTKNFGALYPDSVNLFTLNYNDPSIIPTRPYVSMTYQNIDLTAKQTGFTGTVSYVVNKDLVVKIFGTYQITKAYNAISVDQDKAVEDMIIAAAVTYSTSGGAVSTWQNQQFRDPDNLIEEEDHKWTPTFYGGSSIDYTLPNGKLRLNLNAYYYTQQELYSKYGNEIIDPKLILNAKVSYKVFKENYLYLNMRNLLGDHNEYPYMDEIRTSILAGLHIDF